MIAKLFGRIVVWFGGVAILLFVPAGTASWIGGWVFLLELVSACAFIGVRLAKLDPKLLSERLSMPIHSDQTASDKIILSVMLCLIFASFPLAALDAVRFGWSSTPIWAQVVGVILIGLSMALTYRALQQNTFATHVVKIQQKRQQTVIATGPYRIVRHPMHFARLLLFIGAPLVLGSLWGLLISATLIALLCARIHFEEKTLRAGLLGYTAYTNRVRYRLIPLIW